MVYELELEIVRCITSSRLRRSIELDRLDGRLQASRRQITSACSSLRAASILFPVVERGIYDLDLTMLAEAKEAGFDVWMYEQHRQNRFNHTGRSAKRRRRGRS